ncbi:hypothetical protein XFF6992_470017 [Xanthomonas citri pv. fuscans]|nr:hypothetical protein XFF6992_470017 [Xanthomonas citri pv. fuscans]
MRIWRTRLSAHVLYDAGHTFAQAQSPAIPAGLSTRGHWQEQRVLIEGCTRLSALRCLQGPRGTGAARGLTHLRCRHT